MNIERRMSLGVQWAETDELPTGSPELRELTGKHSEVNASLQLACVDAGCVI
jgi:hypothetical protein